MIQWIFKNIPISRTLEGFDYEPYNAKTYQFVLASIRFGQNFEIFFVCREFLLKNYRISPVAQFFHRVVQMLMLRVGLSEKSCRYQWNWPRLSRIRSTDPCI